MSYWGGAWTEGKGDNPMRYSGGLLGGSWLSSLTADLGNGLFDGAWLVQNFESLNPANTHWSKLYNLFANVDSESERFLEFERWWGGYYLMTTEEIEWIVQNLFVGNKLWRGETHTAHGDVFDLRKIRSPIVLFASKGDNITPPQQAFNWIADVYSCTEEIIANGQVIVGLVHEDVGHLGIFVSGKVATKEHAEIVSVMKSIEALPPGLYEMRIHDNKDAEGAVDYDVELVPKRLQEVAKVLNRFELWEIERRAALLKDYRELLPDVPDYEMRRIRGRQALICTLEPDRAIATLPRLLGEPSDRARLAELFQRIEADPRINAQSVTDEQRATYDRIRQAVGSGVAPLRAVVGE